MAEKYSVYTKIKNSKPPLLVLLGKNYKSSQGPIAVAKKAMKQLLQKDNRVRKKNLYIRKHNSNIIKVYRVSTRKIKPVVVKLKNISITYKMKRTAKYLYSIDSYKILS